jgi:hypothetical protein
LDSLDSSLVGCPIFGVHFTYSIHDTEDFYRAGLIPLDRLALKPEQKKFRSHLESRWKDE